MARGIKLKVGDRIALKEDESIFGVVVNEQEPNESNRIWSVHLYNSPKNTKRRDFIMNRGIYTQDELTKLKPKQSIDAKALTDVE